MHRRIKFGATTAGATARQAQSKSSYQEDSQDFLVFFHSVRSFRPTLCCKIQLFLKRAKRILVAPLNWGLGHASRCVPIIRSLLALGHEPILGSEGGALALLRREFPDLAHVELPAYGVEYRSSSMFWNMCRQSPRFWRAIQQERQFLRHSISQGRFEALISDNRFGLGTKAIPSVFITHQVQIPAPWPWRGLVNRLNHGFIREYGACWIPDWPDGRLAGELAQTCPQLPPIAHLGPLSRLAPQSLPPSFAPYWLVVLLSGPEPRRSELEAALWPHLQAADKPSVLIRGLAQGNSQAQQAGKVLVYDYLAGDELAQTLQRACWVVCRSGYSSLMDLEVLSIQQALLLPTSGQPEQEYLARHWAERKGFRQGSENQLDEIFKLPYTYIPPLIAEKSDLLAALAQEIGTWNNF